MPAADKVLTSYECYTIIQTTRKKKLKNKQSTRFRQNFHLCIFALEISSTRFNSLFLRLQILLMLDDQLSFHHHIVL